MCHFITDVIASMLFPNITDPQGESHINEIMLLILIFLIYLSPSLPFLFQQVLGEKVKYT